MTALTTNVDEKLKVYQALQGGTYFLLSSVPCRIIILLYQLSDIQNLFVSKQNSLSQFNENTLVKGVSLVFNH